MSTKIHDKRDEPGIPIRDINVGRWFVCNLGLFLKAGDEVVVDMQNGRRIPFDEEHLGQPVEVSIMIESKLMTTDNDLPAEVKQLVGRCEANEHTFDNDDMSAALHFGQSLWRQAQDLRDALWSAVRDSDSLGVIGSDFDICSLCDAEDEPGMLAKGVPHEPHCLCYGCSECRSVRHPAEGSDG